MLEVDPNVPVGIIIGQKYSQQETVVAPDTVLFLYTDGLTEATRIDGQLFGEERVLETLSGCKKGTSSKDLVDHMSAAVAGFVEDAEQSDDLTMLAIKVLSN